MHSLSLSLHGSLGCLEVRHDYTVQSLTTTLSSITAEVLN